MINSAPLLRLGRLASVTLAAVAVTALAGCGGGTFEDKAATTTADESGQDSGADGFSPEAVALGEELLGQFGVEPSDIDELESGCLGSSLIDTLGETDAQGLVTVDNPTTEQLDAVEASFDACISGRTLAPTVTSLFFSELPGAPVPDQSVESCVAGEIDGATGQLIAGLVSTSETGGLPREFLETLDVCVPDQVVVDLFVEELTADGTFTPEQATCIAEQVAPELSVSALAAAGQDGTLPPDVEALIEAATLECTGGA